MLHYWCKQTSGLRRSGTGYRSVLLWSELGCAEGEHCSEVYEVAGTCWDQFCEEKECAGVKVLKWSGHAKNKFCEERKRVMQLSSMVWTYWVLVSEERILEQNLWDGLDIMKLNLWREVAENWRAKCASEMTRNIEVGWALGWQIDRALAEQGPV